jgi:hypothetical protein
VEFAKQLVLFLSSGKQPKESLIKRRKEEEERPRQTSLDPLIHLHPFAIIVENGIKVETKGRRKKVRRI